ncbi:MAG TPA: arsenite methyltransferase [Nitrososphaerales archaeon]|nr:arsenite methyltransferase [Nitrososphaerales archaeon]
MDQNSELDVRKAVRERYAKLATSVDSSCGDDGCCGGSQLISIGESIPAEAASINAGCGSPLLLISPKEGDTVLDLGSGGGIDVFRASQLVGESGRAIGVDATPEMISRARETAEKHGEKYQNVEFRLGEIENLPVQSDSIDYVISNCVINLSPNKRRVFEEVFRVLKPNGILAVADITVDKEIPDSARTNMDSWSACIAGAISTAQYRDLLTSAGFSDVELETLQDSSVRENSDSHKYAFKTFSSHIKARKPLSRPVL